jgi:pseudaminic acid synthase
MIKKISIGNKNIGEDSPVFIIGELSANHNQKFELAVKTIEAMAKAGVDAIKIQTYTADTITLDSDKPDFLITQGTIWDGQKLHGLYQKAYTPWDWQPKLQKIAEKYGIPLFSSPFDKTAVDFLEKMNVPAYKVASFEITDTPLIKYMASKGKPMIISTGIATLEDIKLAIKTCKDEGNDQIILLKCTSTYPTPLSDVNLKTMMDLKRKFDVIVGVSDHTMGITVPIAAVALGAKVIEKHVILDRSLGGPDSKFSLEPAELKQLVTSVRDVEKALGEVTYDLTPKALKDRDFRRSLYIVRDIKEGEKITEQNVRSIRPGFGLHPKYYEKVLGKKINKNVSMGTRLSWKLIKSNNKK